LRIAAVIPARFASTRLPGKPLADIHGQPMIRRVLERVRLARRLQRVLVATDDERIAAVVREAGGEAVMTSRSHRSGTDRLAEAAASLEADVILNVQGDEPLIDPAPLDALAAAMQDDAAIAMGTLAVPLRSLDDMLAPAVVKVTVDQRGDALYFSRSPIPHVRVPTGDARAAAQLAVERGLARRHLGVYAYRRETLLTFASWPEAPLEAAEGLEQLRALHHGVRIRVVDVAGDGGVAVDTPEDLERVRRLWSQAGAGRAS
jgi:3-deoxy-manno-octulosonate cytidylyltransferase (CMP-KDO synthetase)